jgi:hypothetical protein
MPGNWTMYGRQLMICSLLTPDAVVALGSLQIALTTTVPVANASALQLEEPTGSYQRQPYQASGTWWGPTGFGEIYNTHAVVFPTVTDASWGLIRGWALIDPVAGQCLAVGSIQDPFVADVGVAPQIEPGTLLLGNYD